MVVMVQGVIRKEGHTTKHYSIKMHITVNLTQIRLEINFEVTCPILLNNLLFKFINLLIILYLFYKIFIL